MGTKDDLSQSVSKGFTNGNSQKHNPSTTNTNPYYKPPAKPVETPQPVKAKLEMPPTKSSVKSKKGSPMTEDTHVKLLLKCTSWTIVVLPIILVINIGASLWVRNFYSISSEFLDSNGLASIMANFVFVIPVAFMFLFGLSLLWQCLQSATYLSTSQNAALAKACTYTVKSKTQNLLSMILLAVFGIECIFLAPWWVLVTTLIGMYALALLRVTISYSHAYIGCKNYLYRAKNNI